MGVEVPERWEPEALGRLIDLASGRRPSLSPSASVPVYGGNGLMGFTDKEMVLDSAIVIGRVGAAGVINRAPAGAWISDNALYVTQVSPRLALDFLEIALVHAKLPRLASASSHPSISQSRIKGVEILLPPLPEQKKIAEILSSVDAAIAATQKVIDQTERVKKGLLQTLMTRGIGHTRFKQTEIGEIPESWEVVRLSQLAKVQTGLSKSRNRKGDFIEMPYLRVANVQDGYLDLGNIKRIRVPRDSVERYSLQAGDVLMTEGGDLDKLGRGAIWRAQIPGPVVHQNHVFAVRTDPTRLLPEFLDYATSSHQGRKYFLLAAKRTTNLASINSSQLNAFPVPCPPLQEQRAIVARLVAFQRASRSHSDQGMALQTLKRGLLQDLLTGRVRVNVA